MEAKTTAPRLVAFMIFPVFFVYHALAAFGAIPLFLGSWFSLSLGLGLAMLLPFALPIAVKTWRIHLPIICLTAITAGYAVYFYRWGAPYQNSTMYFMYTAKMIVGWGGLYCLGLLLHPSERFAKMGFWAVVVMAVATPFLIQTPAYSLDEKVRSASEGVASYQYFAMAFAFTAIFAVSANWRNGRDAFVIGISLPTIYFLLARSDLIGFFAVTLGWFILVALRREWKTITLSFVAMAITVVFMISAINASPWLESIDLSSLYEAPAIETQTNGNSGPKQQIAPPIAPPIAPSAPTPNFATQVADRQAEAFDLAASPSWAYRMDYLRKGWEGIKASPIIGDYGGQIRDFNNPGAYIHNMLDAWRQFGVFAFVIYAALSIGGFLVAVWNVVYLRRRDPLWVMTILISGYTLILSLGAKTVFWPLTALAWGLVAARLAERQLAAARRARVAAKAPMNIDTHISTATM